MVNQDRKLSGAVAEAQLADNLEVAAVQFEDHLDQYLMWVCH